MKMTMLLLAMILAAPAADAAQCAPRDQVVKLLADRYGETRRGMGMAANNTVMEVYASADTGTWTITVSDAGGQTCLVASGDGYQPVADALPPEGDPA
jgi:cation diffusion facilitator CzcD-associated flavoprotein CzcO